GLPGSDSDRQSCAPGPYLRPVQLWPSEAPAKRKELRNAQHRNRQHEPEQQRREKSATQSANANLPLETPHSIVDESQRNRLAEPRVPRAHRLAGCDARISNPREPLL